MDKERLRQYSAIKKEIRSIRQQLEEVAAEMYAPKKIRLTGLPNQNGANNEQIERLILKQEKLIKNYYQQLSKLTDERTAIEQSLTELPPTERTVLRCHYLDGKTWEEVCLVVGYSWRQIHRIHSSALQRLREKEKK